MDLVHEVPLAVQLFVYRTNIKDQDAVMSITPYLNGNSNIYKWTVDIEDVDKVLRVVAHINACEVEMMECIRERGFLCHILEE